MLNFKKLNAEKRLGIIAFLLGAVALFAGSPYNGSESKVNLKDLALTTVNGSDLIEPVELADWIIKNNADFTLVDLRDETEFGKYFIPGAMNIQMVDLTNAGLLRNQKIILYSDGDMRASQAWFMLKSNNYKAVYILDGGLAKWKDEILFPKINPNASEDELKEFAKMKEVSKFFGGSPQTTGEEVKEEFVLPEVKMPAQINFSTSKKKKREGC